MSTKLLGSLPAYDNCYHIIGSTKCRKNLFLEERKRVRLKEIIEEIVQRMDDSELIVSTVAYNHIHVLIRSELPYSKICMLLFGASSRLMRKEFPDLIKESQDALWGGKSCEPIKDERHLNNCIPYIQQHRPDNTKV